MPFPNGSAIVCDLSPLVCADVAFERRARLQRAPHRLADIVDDDIEMHRRPMAAIAAQIGAHRRRLRPLLLHQQIDRRRRAQQLDAEREPSSDTQAERRLVERDPFREIVDVDIDQQLHQRRSLVFTMSSIHVIAATALARPSDGIASNDTCSSSSADNPSSSPRRTWE